MNYFRFMRESVRKNYIRSQAENKVLLKELRMRNEDEVWPLSPEIYPNGIESIVADLPGFCFNLARIFWTMSFR